MITSTHKNQWTIRARPFDYYGTLDFTGVGSYAPFVSGNKKHLLQGLKGYFSNSASKWTSWMNAGDSTMTVTSARTVANWPSWATFKYT